MWLGIISSCYCKPFLTSYCGVDFALSCDLIVISHREVSIRCPIKVSSSVTMVIMMMMLVY